MGGGGVCFNKWWIFATCCGNIQGWNWAVCLRISYLADCTYINRECRKKWARKVYLSRNYCTVRVNSVVQENKIWLIQHWPEQRLVCTRKLVSSLPWTMLNLSRTVLFSDVLGSAQFDSALSQRALSFTHKWISDVLDSFSLTLQWIIDVLIWHSTVPYSLTFKNVRSLQNSFWFVKKRRLNNENSLRKKSLGKK